MNSRFKRFGLCAVIVAVVLLVTGGEIAFAQFEFGAKAGIAMADQKFEYVGTQFDRDIGWRTGIGVGFFVDHPLLPKLGLRLEAIYLQKGYQEDFTMTDEFGDVLGNETFHTRVDMLSLNLLARGTLPSGTYAVAGPRLDIRVGKSNDFPEGATPQELEDNYKSVVPGLTFGLGQEFKLLHPGAIFIEAQYYLDLDKLFEKSSNIDETITLKSIEDRSFGLFVGLRF